MIARTIPSNSLSTNFSQKITPLAQNVVTYPETSVFHGLKMWFGFLGLFMKDSAGTESFNKWANAEGGDVIDKCKSNGIFGIFACIIMFILHIVFYSLSSKRKKQGGDPMMIFVLSGVFWIFGLAYIISFSVCEDFGNEFVHVQHRHRFWTRPRALLFLNQSTTSSGQNKFPIC